MTEAGMTFPEILASLTTTPAEQFGDSRRLGRIAPGFQADLVAVRGNPAKRIRSLSSVELTIRAGKVIYRAEH
jgi:imidazolonepropionase-like amidohydrolase